MCSVHSFIAFANSPSALCLCDRRLTFAFLCVSLLLVWNQLSALFAPYLVPTPPQDADQDSVGCPGGLGRCDGRGRHLPPIAILSRLGPSTVQQQRRQTERRPGRPGWPGRPGRRWQERRPGRRSRRRPRRRPGRRPEERRQQWRRGQWGQCFHLEQQCPPEGFSAGRKQPRRRWPSCFSHVRKTASPGQVES